MGTRELAHNIMLLGHTDQGGCGDGVQVMVGGGYAYVGHMFSDGVTVLGVRDPRNPRPVNYLLAAPGTWNLHLADGLLLVVNAVNMFAGGLRPPRGRRVRAAGSGAAVRHQAQPSPGHSELRRLRRPRRGHVRHRPQRRAVCPAVRAGLVVTEPAWTRSG
jgi:hypothetical protein